MNQAPKKHADGVVPKRSFFLPRSVSGAPGFWIGRLIREDGSIVHMLYHVDFLDIPMTFSTSDEARSHARKLSRRPKASKR